MREVAIKDICQKDSSSLKQKELLDSGDYPVYGASGIAGYLNTYHQERAYIGIVKDGSGIGRVAFYPEKTSLIGTMQYILPKKGFDIRYIGYCLQSLDLSKYKQGAAIPHIYFRDYGERFVKVTDDEKKQQAIVSRLDSAFAEIDALKANAEKQLAEARQLFQAELAKCMRPKEGWEEKKLGEVCETLNGLWKGKKPPFVNVGVIRNANFTKDFTLRYDNVEYLDVEEKQYAKRKLQKGDLIIEKSGGSEKQPVGRAVMFDKEDGEFSFSNFTSVLRVKNDILLSRFLYTYLLFIYKRGDTLKMQKATTGIHNIEFDKFLNIDIPIPTFAQQYSIVSRLDALSANIKKLEELQRKTLAECDALKQAMLREVFE